MDNIITEYDINYVWWKGVITGPYTNSQLDNLNWENIGLLIDKMVDQKIVPITPPLNTDMERNPDVPHIITHTRNIPTIIS